MLTKMDFFHTVSLLLEEEELLQKLGKIRSSRDIIKEMSKNAHCSIHSKR